MVLCTKNRRIQKCKYKLNISVKVSSFCSQTKCYNQCPVGGRLLEFVPVDGNIQFSKSLIDCTYVI